MERKQILKSLESALRSDKFWAGMCLAGVYVFADQVIVKPKTGSYIHQHLGLPSPEPKKFFVDLPEYFLFSTAYLGAAFKSGAIQRIVRFIDRPLDQFD